MQNEQDVISNSRTVLTLGKMNSNFCQSLMLHHTKCKK